MSNLLEDEETVQLNIEVDSWESSIREAGKLLEKAHYISWKYIDDMIAIVHLYGPYIVVFENVALAHAQSGSGVYKSGASLITLKQPVAFGNKDNDPVSIVIALASVNHSDHLEFLKKIMIAFSKGVKEKILASENGAEVIEIINEYGEEEEEYEEG